MTQAVLIQLAKDAFTVTMLASMPLLGASLIVGIAISVLQAATQIQEMTLTFVPKVLVVGIVGVVCGPWMINTLTVYTTNLLSSLANYAH
ncbi:MAG TPA: flagellar biosynthesis protein FliQ [Chloroflexota bacterium]|nr:flagellar biosynthesis protein FliQ [Chloroflexota bacterium]